MPNSACDLSIASRRITCSDAHPFDAAALSPGCSIWHYSLPAHHCKVDCAKPLVFGIAALQLMQHATTPSPACSTP